MPPQTHPSLDALHAAAERYYGATYRLNHTVHHRRDRYRLYAYHRVNDANPDAPHCLVIREQAGQHHIAYRDGTPSRTNSMICAFAQLQHAA